MSGYEGFLALTLPRSPLFSLNPPWICEQDS